MTYFKDLTPYSYSKFLAYPSSEKLWNVGWLDRVEPFDKGSVDPELIAKLLLLCKCPLNMYRGWHGCQFCPEYPTKVTDSDGECCLGDGEIRVWSKNGRTYAAPNLIYHYVATHQYRPPDEFLNALREMELPYPRVLQVLEALDSFRRNLTSLEVLHKLLVWIASREKVPMPQEAREATLQAVAVLQKTESPERNMAVVANLESVLSRYRTVPE